jgi:integrase
MKPYKTPSGKYQVRWRVRRGDKEVRHKRTFDKRKDAVEFIENLSAERSRDANAAKRTFNDYADRYLAAARDRVKARTAEHYATSLKPARDFLGERVVGTLRASDADAYLAHLNSKGRRTASMKALWQAFAAVLDMAVRDEALPSNPAHKVSLGTANARGEVKFKAAFLSDEQVDTIADALADRAPYDLLVLFTAYTGLRRGEVAGLDIRHIKAWLTPGGWRGMVKVEQTARYVKGEWMFDTPKTDNSTRDVPVPSWLAERMHEYVAAHPSATDPTAPLWPNRRRGGYTHGERRDHSELPGDVDWSRRWEPSSFCRNVFAPAVAKANVGHVRFHDLRHTFASLCSQNGVPVERVSAWMGHSSIIVTWSTYTHLFRGEDDHAQIEKMARPTTSNVTHIDRSERSV